MVAAYYLDLRIHRVTIVPTAGALGMCDGSLRGSERAEKCIVMSYAGPLAQRKFAPRSKWARDGFDDIREADAMVAQLECAEQYRNVYHAFLIFEAEQLVEHRWREINAVADALLRHGTLNHEGVHAAIYGD